MLLTRVSVKHKGRGSSRIIEIMMTDYLIEKSELKRTFFHYNLKKKKKKEQQIH